MPFHIRAGIVAHPSEAAATTIVQQAIIRHDRE